MRESWTWRAWALWIVALALLNASLTFTNVWPTLRVQWAGGISGELAIVVIGLAVVQRMWGPASARVLTWTAIGWVGLVLGRYVDVTTRSLFGRSPSLYWDLQFVPDVSAMFAVVAQPTRTGALLLALLAVPFIAYAIARWSLARVAEATAHHRAAPSLLSLACAVCVLWGLQAAGVALPTAARIADPAAPVYGAQLAEVVVESSGLGLRALPASPPMRSDFSRLGGADVLLVFMESYGAVSWQRSELATGLTASRSTLESDIRDTGRHVVSSLVESTTFGGESWLSHLSLLSGVEVRDERTTLRLMTESRDTLVKAFGRAGYRTVAIMPGLLNPWPEGRFYGYDEIYDHARLDYRGPPFGWWDLNDQFALARVDALEVEPHDRHPVFIVLPTITTHAPFTPAPPYQPDWSRVLSAAPYDQDEVNRAWEDQPDWTNLAPSYVRSMAYAYAVIGGYLHRRADRDLVLVLVGDHQPPALVSGEDASWNVPVHVIADKPALLERLRHHAFVDGLRPGPEAVARMDGLLPILLDAFGDVSSSPSALR